METVVSIDDGPDVFEILSHTFVYKLGRLLGSGCGGAVYELQDQPNRVVKIMRLHDEFTRDCLVSQHLGKLGVGPVVYEYSTARARPLQESKDCPMISVGVLEMERLEETLQSMLLKATSSLHHLRPNLETLFYNLLDAGYEYHDIHPGNIMRQGEKLHFIDFEGVCQSESDFNKSERVNDMYESLQESAICLH